MIMSEIKKNIETCRGEDVLAEVSGLTQDPHFGSLVNEALDPLKQQAAAQEGWDGYSEVIEQHKPYTFASAIIQMKSNLLLLLRALWQFPFGSGTLRSLSDDASLRSLSDDASLRSLADMWQHYITRLQGDETYGIPSRLDQLTDLPSAPLLVSDRKMYDGLYDANGDPVLQDGESLIALLTNSARAARVVEIRDTNIGWTNNKDLTSLLTLFPNVKTLRCKFKNSTTDLIYSNKVIENLYLDEYEGGARIVGNGGYGYGVKNLYAPKMTWLNAAGGYTPSFGNKLVHLYAPTWAGWNGSATTSYGIVDCPDLVFAEIGDWTDANTSKYLFYNCPNLIEVRLNEQSHSLNLQSWNPTNALDASLDTLVTDEDCHNNLEQFLKNFRTYIALRLATYTGSGKTLTLSQAVYDAIKDESHLFVFDEGTMTIYAYLTNIKHWTVTK